MKRLCVFCGSSRGARAEYAAAAHALAAAMLARKIDLVFGGGHVGLMGVIADAVLAGGGHVTGVIPHALIAREIAHHGLPDLRVVSSMHERKALMASLSDAFVALPGGFGTFEELFEVLTWTQLDVHRKRCGLLNAQGFYDPLIALVDRAVDEGFIKPENRDLVTIDSDPGALLDRLSRPLEAPQEKWIRSPPET